MERDARKIYAASLFHISTHTLTWSVTSYLSLAYDNIDISTHTLTWSVTFFLVLLVDLNDISTHTLTWSVTTGLDTLDDELLHFNSHAHVERDVLL